MKPIIALIGRSNVGKSTLFNKLTKTKNSLISNYSNLTRDRKYGYGKWKNYEFIVVDTGGIDFSKERIKKKITDQSLLAIKESNIVLFLVNVHEGILSEDYKIAKFLRHYNKTILVINKIDTMNNNSLEIFYGLNLGGFISISALYNKGINLLLRKIFSLKNNFLLEKTLETNKVKNLKNNKHSTLLKLIKLAIIGRPNVGKSTLINAIIGEKRLITFDMPGTTRDNIHVPVTYNGQKYVLIDTAGIKKKKEILKEEEEISIMKTIQSIQESYVVLLVIDSSNGLLKQDFLLLNFILKTGKPLVIAMNKWDLLSKESKNDLRKTIISHFKFLRFIKIHFISSIKKYGIYNIFSSVNDTYKNSVKKINSNSLTKIMKLATKEHSPPFFNGKKIKLKFAHIGGYYPINIIIHGNRVKNIPIFYKKYLINRFYYDLKITGVPICISFKEINNSSCN